LSSQIQPRSALDYWRRVSRSQQAKGETKFRVKPDNLLRRGTKAIVTGAPGCGKTTLLKYLALQAQQDDNRLVVWLELKAIHQSSFVRAEETAVLKDSLILQELWLKHLASQLALTEAEVKFLREHWQIKFKENGITVLLDGFDELQDGRMERSLNNSIRQFVAGLSENSLLITTRPYAQHRLGQEGFQELEIEPLSQEQIEAFLVCYFPDDASTKSLLRMVRERPAVQELLHVPLLLGIVLRLHRENRVANERLDLFEIIVNDLIHELDRSKAVTRRFKIDDEKLRLDFLSFLAYELLLVDRLVQGEQESSRVVFSYDVLKEKAKHFLAAERSSYTPRELIDDAIATPLLQELSKENFAFSHLTLQEYLAARTLASLYRRNQLEAMKTFFCGYYNLSVVEMEVLSMTLGILPNADKLYGELELAPESLTYASFRLRGRGLAYGAVIEEVTLNMLGDRLMQFVMDENSFEQPYRDLVITSFSHMAETYESLLIPRITALLDAKDSKLNSCGARALTLVGSTLSIRELISRAKYGDRILGGIIAQALSDFGNRSILDQVFQLLPQDHDLRRIIHLRPEQSVNDASMSPVFTYFNPYEHLSLCQLLANSISNDSGPCIRAARELARRGHEYLSNKIEQALRCSEISARKKAIQMIGYYSDNPRSVGDLSKIANTDIDKDIADLASEVGRQLVHKLEQLGQSRSRDSASRPVILTLPNDNISKESVLVHEVGLIVSAAGHFFREIVKFDEGIDGEIEFRNSQGRATGRRLYLQLKSGDSYLRRLKNGKYVFYLKQRHAGYWLSQAYPVFLIIRDSSGDIRWMNITEYLQQNDPYKSKVEFQGESFTSETLNRIAARELLR
jgi:energy-coupling factor transporter ATP-binding protein EcfA2